jgi:hypothetical protein
MPRLVHALPKYRLYKGSGKAVVTLNGKDRYLGTHGAAACRRKYDCLIREFLTSERSASFGAAAHDVTAPWSRSAWPTFATLRATTAPVRPANTTESFGNYPFDSSK